MGYFSTHRFYGRPYIFGRDAVASSVLAERYSDIERALDEEGLNQDERDLRQFWTIVGLVESDRLDKADKLVNSFRPADPRLLLAIQLGCFLIQHLRVTTREERRIATSIGESLWSRVQPLKDALLSEFKSEILEVQQGEIKALGKQTRETI